MKPIVALLASQCPGLTALQLKELILENATHLPSLHSKVIDGRFLNVQAAADACTALQEVGPDGKPEGRENHPPTVHNVPSGSHSIHN